MNFLAHPFEYVAAFPVTNPSQVDACCAGKEEFAQVEHLYARIELLAQSALQEGLENYVREAAAKGEPGRYHDLIHRQVYDGLIHCELERLTRLGLIPTFTPQWMTRLPLGSFALQFTFVLEKPWFSKDDVAFYPIDNPVRKEKLFKVPVMSSAAAKGLLRWTVRMEKGLIAHLEKDPNMEKWKDDAQTLRLFGTPKGERDPSRFRAGRLATYPTFFNRIELEVINPHDRKTRAGTKPILYEVVPAGANGTFSLLYVPFDRIGQDVLETRREMAEDLQLLGRALFSLMCLYGFSAKRTAGWGAAADQFAEGTVGRIWFQDGTHWTFTAISDIASLARQ